MYFYMYNVYRGPQKISFCWLGDSETNVAKKF